MVLRYLPENHSDLAADLGRSLAVMDRQPG